MPSPIEVGLALVVGGVLIGGSYFVWHGIGGRRLALSLDIGGGHEPPSVSLELQDASEYSDCSLESAGYQQVSALTEDSLRIEPHLQIRNSGQGDAQITDIRRDIVGFEQPEDFTHGFNLEVTGLAGSDLRTDDEIPPNSIQLSQDQVAIHHDKSLAELESIETIVLRYALTITDDHCEYEITHTFSIEMEPEQALARQFE